MTPHVSPGQDCTINPIVIDDSKRSAKNPQRTSIKDKWIIEIGIGVVFFLGCASSMVVLMVAMQMYGDTTVTIELIRGTAGYWLIPVAILTFIGLCLIGWRKHP